MTINKKAGPKAPAEQLQPHGYFAYICANRERRVADGQACRTIAPPTSNLSKQIFDQALALLLLPLLCIPMGIIAIIIKLTSEGPVLYWSDRIGRYNVIFKMPKFRTMKVNTPEVATHLLSDPKAHLTVLGSFLRRTSLDELPQIFSILKGELSFVGPRPALFTQDDLVALRTARGVHELMPGLTGWAQINGRDDLAIPVKVDYDYKYLQNRSLLFDLKILALTVTRVVQGKGVAH